MFWPLRLLNKPDKVGCNYLQVNILSVLDAGSRISDFFRWVLDINTELCYYGISNIIKFMNTREQSFGTTIELSRLPTKAFHNSKVQGWPIFHGVGLNASGLLPGLISV